MPKSIMVFSIFELPSDLQRQIHELAVGAYSGECHVPWTVGAEEGENAIGWISSQYEREINKFFEGCGIPKGDDVLIHNWW